MSMALEKTYQAFMARGRVLLDASRQPVKMEASAYRGASHSKEMANWYPGSFSADAAILPDREVAEDRAWDLARNNGLIGGALRTLGDNVIGRGLKLSAKPEWRVLGWTQDRANEWAKKVEALWRGYAESTFCDAAREVNLHGLAGQALLGALVAGDMLVVYLWLKNRPGARYATSLLLKEGACLGNPNGALDTDRIRGGVERDQYGGAVAYHVRTRHPGNGWTLGTRGPNKYERIPAYTKWGRRDALLFYNKERPGQTRGITYLSGVMAQAKTLDHYEKMELQSAILQNALRVFIQTPMSGEEFAGMLNSMSSTPEAYADLSRENLAKQGPIIPGSPAISQLLPGESIEVLDNKNPSANYPAFTETSLKRISSGLNMSLQSFLRDYTKTTFAGGRLALLSDWRFFMGRRVWLANYFYQPTFENWLEEAINKGEVEAQGFYQNRAAYSRAVWIGPGKGWVDPEKEAKYLEKLLSLGVITYEEVCHVLGYDHDDVSTQLVREIAERKARGLPLPPGMEKDGQEKEAA